MSSAFPGRLSGTGLDLSPRFTRTATVVASPSAATETIIASLTIPNPVQVNTGILLIGYAAFTAGTAGVSANLRIRQTDASGTVIKASGAVTVVAASLYDRCIAGLDASPTLPAQVYVLTLTVGSANAASTVSAVEFAALVI